LERDYKPKEILHSTTGALQANESALSGWKYRHGHQHRKDELAEYLSRSTVETTNPRQWWIQHMTEHPTLHLMALYILAIPGMLAQVERIFSSAGLSITTRQNRLKEDIVEALKCQKSWYRSGLLSFPDLEQLSEVLSILERDE